MSTLKVNNLQVGQSATATNNFTLYQPSTPDGTVRLGYGNTGSVTDTLTLTNTGTVGIGITNPTQKLEVSGRTVIKTGVGPFYALKVLDYTNSTGLYLGSVSGGAAWYIGDSYYHNSLLWRTDKTSASSINFINGSVEFYTNSGLTAGVDFTPSRKAILDVNGNLLINRSSATGTSSQRLQVESGAYINGNVGIGTANPGTKLDVYGDVAINGTFALRRVSYGYSSTYQNVLIGSPNSIANTVSLCVDVSAIAGGNFHGQNQVVIPHQGLIVPNQAGTNFIGVLSRDANDYIRIGPDAPGGISSGPITITTSNVGIGTTGPFSKLDIRYSSSTAYSSTSSPQTANSFFLFNTDTTATTTFSSIALGNRRNGNTGVVGIECVGTGNDAAALAFKTQSAGPVFTEVARFDSSGNVGIGITNPSSKLHVIGTTTIQGVSSGAVTKVYSYNGQPATGHIPGVYTFVRYLPVVSLGTQLRIPIPYQANYNSHSLVRVRGTSAIYNSRDSLYFDVSFGVGYLTVISNFTTYFQSGNIASITTTTGSVSAPHYVNINFTTAYTGATSNGINLWLEYFTAVEGYSIDVNSITLN